MSNEFTPGQADHIVAAPYTKLEELSEYEQRGAQIVSVNMTELPLAALAATGTFLTALEKTKGTQVVREYQNITIYLDLTPEQVQEKLDAANDQLASDRQKYLTAVQFGTGDEWDVKAAVKRFGKRAGLDTVLPVSV